MRSQARPTIMNHMLRARWLVAAIAVLCAASCSGGAGVSQTTGSPSGWLTYTPPPGPMHLTFRYPRTWKVRGATLVSAGGVVGIAQVTGDTSATTAEFNAVDCEKTVQLLHGSGVDVTWSANLGSMSPIRLSQTAGRTVRVNGHPARLGETKSTVCGPETLIACHIGSSPQDRISPLIARRPFSLKRCCLSA
jgi:hypothetical protein